VAREGSGAKRRIDLDRLDRPNRPIERSKAGLKKHGIARPSQWQRKGNYAVAMNRAGNGRSGKTVGVTDELRASGTAVPEALKRAGLSDGGWAPGLGPGW